MFRLIGAQGARPLREQGTGEMPQARSLTWKVFNASPTESELSILEAPINPLQVLIYIATKFAKTANIKKTDESVFLAQFFFSSLNVLFVKPLELVCKHSRDHRQLLYM